MRQVAAVALAALVSAGCLSVGVTALPKATPAPERVGTAFQDPLLITGTVRVGRPGLVNNSGAALIGNAGAGLTSAAPLANTNALDGMGRMGTITTLTSAAPLGNVAQFRVLAAPKGPTGLYVEAIDLDTGERVGFSRLSDNSTYKVQVPVADYDRGLAIQVTGLAEGKVTGFLAAPAKVAAKFGDVLRLDITPATTALLFSKALVAGVRSELILDKGFRAFVSEGLAYLVRTGEIPELLKAVEKLDSAPDMAEFPDAGKAMEAIVILAEKLAKATGKHGIESGTSFSDIAAAERVIVKEIGRVLEDGIPTTGIINDAIRELPPDLITKEKKKLDDILDDQDTDLGKVTVLPTPTPEPTLTPTPVPTVPPTPTPVPTPTPSPTPVPTPSPAHQISLNLTAVTINALPPTSTPDPRFVTSVTLIATVTGPGTPQGVTWRSSNTSMVVVSETGVVTSAAGAGKGSALVTATSIDDPRVVATASVQVTIDSGLEVEVQ